MQVMDMMNRNVVSLTPDDTAASAAVLFSRYNIGSIPVVSTDGRLRGIVTDRDIVVRCLAAEDLPEATKVRDIMTRNVITVQEDADVREAARMMAEGQVRRLPVTRGGQLVGMLSIGDISRSHACDMEVSKALSDISARPGKFEK